MSFSVLFRRKAKQPTRDIQAQILEIERLRVELKKTGYAAEEVEYMVVSKAGTPHLNSLSLEELAFVVSALEDQLSVAQGCLNLVQHSS